MKKLTVIALFLALTAAGCETMRWWGTGNDAEKEMVTGSETENVMVQKDNDRGEKMKGTDGMAGKAMNKARAATRMSVADVADMARKGVEADVIIDELRRTKSKFNLTVEQIDYLRENNVEGRVVDYMLDTM